MKANTRIFGEIDIADDKIITLEKGMIGFPQLQKFALIFDEEKGLDAGNIMWLQSMDETEIAFPVMLPNKIKSDYAPNVNDEIIAPLGELTDDNTLLLCTVSVPREVTQMSMNLKAPIIINTDNQKGVQIIVEDDYPIKYKFYELLKSNKEKAGE